jgi:hypothetical protein
MGCIISDAQTKEFEATIAAIKNDIIGPQGQSTQKAGFYTQPQASGKNLGQELLALETGIIEALSKNTDNALKLEREALALDCQTRYYQTQLAMLTDPKADPIDKATKDRLELLTFLAQETHLPEQAAHQKTVLASLEEAHKVLAASLSNFKSVEKTLDKLPETQNAAGLPTLRANTHKSLNAQEEVKKGRLNHKPFTEKVATDKVRLTAELQKVHGQHEVILKEFTLNMTNKKKLQDFNDQLTGYTSMKQDLTREYKEHVDEFMADHGNMTTQYHGGPPSPVRTLTNPHNIIV